MRLSIILIILLFAFFGFWSGKMNNQEPRFANQLNIQWFPGHMTKTLRMMEQEIQHVDASLVLLDARIPLSSLNPEIERITARKPKLYALNKADLADPAVTEEWIRYFHAADAGCVAISAKQKGGANAVKAAIEKELGDCFFALVNVARKLDIDSEKATLTTVHKFRSRFGFIEDELAKLAQGLDIMRKMLVYREEKEHEMRVAQDKLVLGMAHDLRTPLTGLMTYIEILRKQENEGKVSREYIDKAFDKIFQIRALSDQMFEYFFE